MARTGLRRSEKARSATATPTQTSARTATSIAVAAAEPDGQLQPTLRRRALLLLVPLAILLGALRLAWFVDVVSARPAAHYTEPAAAPPSPLRPTPRNAVAEHWAPTIYQETRDERDLLAAFDYDGDWDGADNAANVSRFPKRAVVYSTVAETATHWFVTYILYHPIDAKGMFGHDHDTEHLTLVVRKDGSRFGKLEAMETRFHEVMYQYAAPGSGVRDGADDVDGRIHFDGGGRPTVKVQRVGHGICGGDTPISFVDTLALQCRHEQTPRIERHGVVYRYTGRAEVPRSLDDRDVGYALVEVGDSLWGHARDIGRDAGGGTTFSSAMDFAGARCGVYPCPRGIGRVLAAAPGHGTTGLPWEERSGRGGTVRGEHFFDPAWTLGRRLRFPAPYSTDYLWNPYLAVGGFEAGPRLASLKPGGLRR